jgi:hypothetical protein
LDKTRANLKVLFLMIEKSIEKQNVQQYRTTFNGRKNLAEIKS